MGFPRIIGTEVEYGIAVLNDPAFNPVTASAAVVNAYGGGADRIRWSYDDESPGRDARGFSLGEIPIDETDTGLVNSVLHKAPVSTSTMRTPNTRRPNVPIRSKRRCTTKPARW